MESNETALTLPHVLCYKGYKKFGKCPKILYTKVWFFCAEILQPSQPIRVMLSVVSLPDHTFPRQA